MKLATRLTLVIGSCAAVLIGAGGIVLLRSEARDLRTVALNETSLLTRSLQTAFENALRDRQIEDVNETLGALARVDPSVAIFVFDEEGKLVGASEGATPSEATRAVEARAREQSQPVVDTASAETLRIGLRLREETPESASAIVVEKPLAEMQRDLDTTRRNIAFTTALFVIVVAALTWLLARRYVGRPLGEMVTNMRRVRSGDFTIAATAKRHDEVGEARDAFEKLVEDLAAARARADAEVETRRRVERALQDADKLVTLGELSAVMAHEIGSPLQILEGRARALLKHPDDEEATRRTAAMMVEQTERITRIVDQMLSITRRRPPVRASIDAETHVRRVVALLEIEARHKQVRLLVTCTGVTRVSADADQLQQVVLNIVRNALQAAPPGSTVHIDVGGDDSGLVLDVRDEGSGVAKADRHRLFEPFFTTKARIGGSGLGLSVVKTIVQEHGGKVDFIEPDSPGCHVRVVLPRHTEVA